MAYRGDDLDLRTPQARSTGREADQPNWWTRTAVYKGGRADPIWVDDHVMACCNHAYDLALAHRAPEVRLEHLINALTLNDHASLVLEARGFSVASLRRESGSAIANDIPAGSNGGSPKRSEGLEEALRQAADQAYPRRVPVSVDDILHVLFDMKRDLPGLQLLRRHATSWSGRNGAEPRPDLRLEPLPHLARPQPAPRYSTATDYFNDPPREPTRYASPPREYVRETPREPVRPPAPAAITDSFQDARLDTLERMVRDLGVDLADDRKTIRSLVGDLQRTTSTQADDTGRFHGGLNDRLASLEDSLARSRNETAALPSALMDRIGMIERTIDVRLAEAGRSQGVSPMLLDRLAGLERAIEIRMSDPGRPSGPSPALLDRLAGIERGIEARLIDMSRATIAMNERLQSIEQVSQRPVEASLSPLVSQRLDSITQFGTKMDAVERTFQLILDRMTGLERKLVTVAETRQQVDFSGVENRLAGLERNMQRAVEESVDMAPLTDLLSGIENRVSGLERTLDNRAAETGRTVSFIGERLRAFEEAIGGQKTTTVDRLGQIERSLTAFAESTVAAGSSHENDLGEVHEALLKLNANQQTLAGSLDQWRLDNTGDLSVVNNRLKTIEDVEQRRAPQMEVISAQIAAVHKALARREARKSRFMHWLFGTDEWYSSSYDTKRWRANQAAEAIIAPLATSRPVETVQIQQRPVPTPAAPPPPPALRR